jgi:asparagine synthase (glutamine-hydrolysing)
MCGIAGCLNFRNGIHPDETVLRQMLGMIRHRGPDQFGIFLDDIAGLGNARLSIVDLAAGQQPFATEDGRYWIVYNGEIFNHADLRAELVAAGHKLATHCDTEVFLHLFEQEGPSCLTRLNGQFAVAIWDTLTQTLFLARDRLGVRPLFYWRDDNNLVFGSEIKAVAAHPAVKLELELDPLALDQVFTGWSCQPPRTPFIGISQLPPGHFAIVSRDGIKTERYWQASFAATDPAESARSEAAWLDELSALLTDATRLRLMADVPVGAYLSGGLDSSLIAALMRRHAAGKIDTFSIAFTDSAFDESEHQRRMAHYLGTEHQVVQASHADIGAIFPDVVWHCETPLLRTAPAPMYLLARLVHRSKYKVVLTGEGADEFFAGYDIFKEARIRAFWAREPGSTRRPQLFQRIYPDLQSLNKVGAHYLAAFFGEGLADTDAPGYSHAIRWRNTRRTQRFFSQELTRRIQDAAKPFIESIPRPQNFPRWNLLERAQYLEIAAFMSTYLLSSQGDRVAMAHSVEGRFPFLDYRVAEFAGRLPARLRLRGLRDKYLLRKLGASLLPAEIWNRPKKPYRAPIHRSFFNDQEAPYVRELLSAAALRESGLFNPQAIEKLVAKIDQGQPLGETDDMAVAGVISTQLVHQRFVKDFRKAPPVTDRDDVLLHDHRTVSRKSRSAVGGTGRFFNRA